MQEDGRNLSPSQVAREMLLNCKVLRRKDFTVQPLVAGSGMGTDPNSPSNKSKRMASFRKGEAIALQRSLLGTKSALGQNNKDSYNNVMIFD